MKNIIFIANNNLGNGLSGGDRIFLEFLKSWQNKSKITVFACQESVNLINNYPINNLKIINTTKKITNSNYFSISSLIFHNISRTFHGKISIIKNIETVKSSDYIYSVSDFYPDFFPALMAKIINPKIKWISGFYLFAPNPFASDSPYKKGNFMKGLLYWLMQQPTYLLTKIFADIVFVTSTPDISKFLDKKVYVIQGGVDTNPSNKYFKTNTKPLIKKYAAVFVGRLHHQKGVIKLIDIWKEVARTIPNAKLAIIGDGELESKIRQKISLLKLKHNIALLGFLDGEEKYKVFKQSKVVVHPATYDSGGMAAAEAMAWGLPGVSFDLESLKTYYPKGIIKTKCFNEKQFSKNIIKLLSNKANYLKFSKNARDLILEDWDWAKKANKIFNLVEKDFN